MLSDLRYAFLQLAKAPGFTAVAALTLATQLAGAEPPRHPAVVRPECVGLSTVALGNIKSLLDDYVNQGKIAGAVTLVSRHGQIAQLEAVGWSDIESKTPMTTDALFRIASMTKVATAVAALSLQEEGRFALDDDASRYVPELRNLRVKDPKPANATNAAGTVPLEKPITIRDLLRHTSGLSRNAAFDALFQQPTLWAKKDGLLRLVQTLAQNPLAEQPGTRFRYGLSSDVLGLLLERVTGKPLDEILQQRVFAPLRMSSTGFYVGPDQAGRLTSYYSYEQDRLVRKESSADSPFLRRPESFSGGGGWPDGHAGLLTTAEDWWLFCEMLRGGGQLNGVRVLAEKSIETMETNQLKGMGDGMNPRHPDQGYGCGVGIIVDRDRTQNPGSNGQVFWAGGPYNTYFFIDRDREMVAILLLQTGPWRHLQLMDRFNELVHKAILDPAKSAQADPGSSAKHASDDRATKVDPIVALRSE